MNTVPVHVGRVLVRLGLGLALLAVPACVSDRPNPVEPGPEDGEEVRIASFAFVPSDITVTAGTVVIWTNEDPVLHTVTADDGSFDSSTFSGQTFSLMPDTPGDFPYFCSVHPFMRATLRVIVE